VENSSGSDGGDIFETEEDCRFIVHRLIVEKFRVDTKCNDTIRYDIEEFNMDSKAEYSA